jgi:hypothetical protein
VSEKARELVYVTICISGETDGDPWEWADGIALFLKGELNEQNPSGWPPISVDVEDVVL